MVVEREGSQRTGVGGLLVGGRCTLLALPVLVESAALVLVVFVVLVELLVLLALLMADWLAWLVGGSREALLELFLVVLLIVEISLGMGFLTLEKALVV